MVDIRREWHQGTCLGGPNFPEQLSLGEVWCLNYRSPESAAVPCPQPALLTPPLPQTKGPGTRQHSNATWWTMLGLSKLTLSGLEAHWTAHLSPAPVPSQHLRHKRLGGSGSLTGCMVPPAMTTARHSFTTWAKCTAGFSSRNLRLL